MGLYPAQVFPVQKVGEALGAVPLDDALPPALLAEAVEEGGELRAGIIQAAEPPVQNVDACGVGWGEAGEGRMGDSENRLTPGPLSSPGPKGAGSQPGR